MRFRRFLFFLFAFSLFFYHGSAGGDNRSISNEKSQPLDIVFCLDLSGSTNGLINEARNHFWYLVNQLKAMKPAPDLRIAFVGFSRPSFGKSHAYVKAFTDLTSSFDAVAAEMYHLRPSIEKGDQYVVNALETCINDLSWSKQDDAVKIIFLAGNGLATANGTGYAKICNEALERNIRVHTFYIQNGSPKNTINELPGWKRIAEITNGIQTTIVIGHKDPIQLYNDVPTPQVKFQHQRLVRTFIWEGSDSAVCRKNMESADSGAAVLSKDEYMNRLIYTSTPAFIHSIRNCEIIASVEEESTGDKKDDPFTQRLLAKVRERNKIMEEFSAVLSEDPVRLHHELLQSGTIKSESLFHRNVLLAIMKYWGELPGNE